MQISRIRNITTKNIFQYKYNPANLQALNFQGKDTFEISRKADSKDVVVSKKYCRGEKEYDQSLFLQQGHTLFIKDKNGYVPYTASLKEYNANGELIRNTSFNNGLKYIVTTYKNGQKIQEDRYEDVFGDIKKRSQKTATAKFSGKNEAGKKPLVSFVLTRNHGKNWQNNPTIVMRKMGENSSLMVYLATPSIEKRGEIEITHIMKDKTTYFHSPIYDENDYHLKISPIASINETAVLALEELKEVLKDEEFRADFGGNEKANSELDKAISFLYSKLNED
ncbi:MAG: hypothetical protein IKL52_04905 [Candidatus Gastranaerophilales bacterium]|nr:hypothetical protein [Candidatus Gastranaerophilales bacterium]